MLHTKITNFACSLLIAATSHVTFAQNMVNNQPATTVLEQKTEQTSVNIDCNNPNERDTQIDCLLKHLNTIESNIGLTGSAKYSAEISKKIASIEPIRLSNLEKLVTLLLFDKQIEYIFKEYSSEINNQLESVIIRDISPIKGIELSEGEIEIYKKYYKQFLSQKGPDAAFKKIKGYLIVAYDKKFDDTEIDRLIKIYSDDTYNKLFVYNSELLSSIFTKMGNMSDQEAQMNMYDGIINMAFDVIDEAENTRNDISNNLKNSGYEYDYLNKVDFEQIKKAIVQKFKQMMQNKPR